VQQLAWVDHQSEHRLVVVLVLWLFIVLLRAHVTCGPLHGATVAVSRFDRLLQFYKVGLILINSNNEVLEELETDKGKCSNRKLVVLNKANAKLTYFIQIKDLFVAKRRICFTAIFEPSKNFNTVSRYSGALSEQVVYDLELNLADREVANACVILKETESLFDLLSMRILLTDHEQLAPLAL